VGREPLILVDTHGLVWWVADAARLSARAGRAIGSALRQGPLGASAISLLEIATAIRRRRRVLDAPAEQWLADMRTLPELDFEPVSAGIAEIAGSFDEAFPGELITADAHLLRAPRLQALW
jgi:PIN domain nuclease of toxin-antitoxin system